MEPLKQPNLSSAIITAGIVIAAAVLITGAMHDAHARTVQPTATDNQPVATVPADSSKVVTTGEPFIGDERAPVVMAYWSDYQCPFCQRNEEQVLPQIIKDYVATGKVKIVFKDYAFLGPDSQTLGTFARAVWNTDPAKFYQWHKAIFDHQGTENTGWATQHTILDITTAVLGPTETKQVTDLVATHAMQYQQQMDADKAEGAGFGVNGTPGVIIGKQLVVGAQPYEQFKQAIDAALAQH